MPNNAYMYMYVATVQNQMPGLI